MADSLDPSELGELLDQLKRRSGRTYEAISRRADVSRSAVHRYCTGRAVPPAFGTLERIALACGASRTEILRLHRLWAVATSPETAVIVAEQPTDSTGRPPATIAEDEPRRRVSTARERLVPVLSGAAMIVLLVVTLTGSLLTTQGKQEGRSARPAGQWISGPAWSRPPIDVPSSFFGVTINSATGDMPAFRVGAARLWDGGTRWSEIQPQRGAYDWSVLDRLVGGAERANLPALFVFGGTPRWASALGPPTPYPDGSRAAPPDDLADWDSFVRSLVSRYRGRIEAYELWVLGNDRRFYTGKIETLVEMTRRANRIIRAADPKATVVCPGMGNLWDPAAQRTLTRFAQLHGYDYCDVASVKLFQRTASDPPETILQLTDLVDRLMHRAGIHPRLWSTGTTYSIPLQGSLDATKARNYAVRFFLTGLYAVDVNLERMYFYNWGGTRIPIVLQAVGGEPTQAALAVEQLQRWLAHTQIRSCGHGLQVNLPENVWQCEFRISRSKHHYGAVIMWTSSGTAVITARPGTSSIDRLDGTNTPVTAGDSISVTEQPILVEHDASSATPWLPGKSA